MRFPAFGYSSLDILKSARQYIWILVDTIGSIGSKRKTSEDGHRVGRRGRGAFRQWARGVLADSRKEERKLEFSCVRVRGRVSAFGRIRLLRIRVRVRYMYVRGSVFEFSPMVYILELLR